MVDRPGPVGTTRPLVRRTLAVPEPAPHEVRVAVHACGVCRTDLHLAEGDLAPRRHGVVPGHEVVGVVESRGEHATRFQVGERVGVAWLRSTCGTCRFCRRGDENLCVAPRFTGWDDHGGFAPFAVVDERFAYALPHALDDLHAAPLLCAGIIGYRALVLADLPAGGVLGLYGFGASAHITAQVARHLGARVHVMTRSADSRRLALELGASSAGGAADPPPEPLDSAILFAPVGTLVPPALEALDAGGTLAIAGIHLTDVPVLDYQRHLFRERTVRSVTANTRADGEALLALAAEAEVRVEAVPYGFDRADVALADLAADRVTGAAVLVL
nr:zinc-binding alcohol dehydrogenase family protein [Actinomarinicola tropica]